MGACHARRRRLWLGRFYVAYGTLDEDDELERPIAESYIDWSGEGVLIPAGTTDPGTADA